MKYTENYGFDKPEGTDFVDVEHFNTNAELLDKLLCPEYSEAEELTELKNGEKLSVAFAKIAKIVKEFISHIKDKISHLTEEEHKELTGLIRLDITGETVDVDKYTLSGGTPKIMRIISKTNGGSSNITNIPVTGFPFIMDIELIRWASATDYITRQKFVNANNPENEYVRYCTNGVWGAWVTRVFTDTKYTHPSYTSRTGVPTANQTPAFGGTFTVTQPVSDGSGHITGMNSRTITIPSAVVTTGKAGLMSTADKTKLNGIAEGANKYTHPTTSGNKHIPSGGSSGQILRWSADGTAAWGNDNNTTYSNATTSAAGLMSASDKTKLNGIATGANKTTIVANLTTTVAGSALDATIGKTLYSYITALQADVKYLKHLTNTLGADFTEAKYLKKYPHSELGNVNIAYMPYDTWNALTTSNKVIIGFTDGAIGVFSIDTKSQPILGQTITWIKGSVPYVAKATIQAGTPTLALASGSSASAGYIHWDDELYQESGEVKQTLVFEFSASSKTPSVFYKII